MLLLIAAWARPANIVRRVRAAACDRYSVIQMSILAQRASAVMTAPVLCLKQQLQVCGGHGFVSGITPFTRTAKMLVLTRGSGVSLFPIRATFGPPSAVIPHAFRVFRGPSCGVDPPTFPVC